MLQNNYQQNFEGQLPSLDLQIRRKSVHSKNYILLLIEDDLLQDSYYLYINLFCRKKHIVQKKAHYWLR
jgi:hypothetical protein